MATRKKSRKRSSRKPARKASQAAGTTQQTIDQHPRPVQQASETANVIPVGTGIEQHPRPVHQMEFRLGPEAVAKTAVAIRPASYSAKFTELFEVFEPLISLKEAATVELYKAVKKIPKLSQQEVRIASNDKRTSVGGRIVV